MKKETWTLTQYLERRLTSDPKFRAEYNRIMKVNKPAEIVFDAVEREGQPHLRQVSFIVGRANYTMGNEVYVRNPTLNAVIPVYKNQPGSFLENVLRVSGIEQGFEIYLRTVRKV